MVLGIIACIIRKLFSIIIMTTVFTCFHYIVITPIIFIIIVIFSYYHCRRVLMIKETNYWSVYFLLKKETSCRVNACALGF